MHEIQALPLYLQISEMLNRDIRAGRLVAGTRLPPEREMATQLHTSVGTLRKALADLAEKGLLERRQGSGNYIRKPGKDSGIYAFFRLEKLVGGGLPSAAFIGLDTVAKPAEVPEFGTSRMAYRLRRLRLLDAAPVAVEEIWIDADATPGLTRGHLSDALYQTYRKHFGFWIARVEDRVGLSVLPDWTPETVDAGPGTTCGYVERLGWARGADPVEYSRTWFDADRARYVARQT